MNILRSILLEARETNYINPSIEDQSYVGLMLVIGTSKRFIPELNTLGTLESDDEEAMVKLGVQLLRGEVTADTYIKKFEKIVKVKIEDDCANAITSRLDMMKVSSPKNKELEDETRKSINKNGTLKESIEDKPIKAVELTEAVDKEQIKNLIKSKGSISILEVLNELGIEPTTPPNSKQVAIFLALKKMLAKGEITREKVGKKFLYSINTGEQKVTTPVQKAISKRKKKTVEEVLDILNSNWYGRNRWEGDYLPWFSIETGERGPRTDHGGGEDGDGWLSSSEIQKLAKPYKMHYEPKLKDLANTLKSKGITVEEYYVDYGEKGHVSLQIKISPESIQA
jgi:hypothetical protein